MGKINFKHVLKSSWFCFVCFDFCSEVPGNASRKAFKDLIDSAESSVKYDETDDSG